MKHLIKATGLLLGIILSCNANAQVNYTNLDWLEETPGIGNTYFHTASIVISGYLFVTTNVVDGTDTEILTLKFDTNGDTLWAKTFGGNANGNDYGIDLRRDSNNDIIVIGAVETTAGGYD